MSVSRRPDGRWRARYRDRSGREHARHFDRKVDADRWVTAEKAKIDRGDWLDPSLSRITISQWGPTWLESKVGRKATTFKDYESVWRILVEPRWGTVPLSGVTHADVVAWQAELTRTGLSPARINRALLVLKQLMQLAVDDQRLSRNPAALVKPQRLARGEKRFLTHQSLGALADECGEVHPGYRTFVLTLGYTGLRWGEARALRANRIDLLRRRIVVAENLPDGSREAEVVPPKSHLHRSVPLPKFLAEDLAQHLVTLKPRDLVFTADKGGLLDNSNFRRNVFDPAVRRLGLDPLTPHNLRDTAASLAVSAGANVKVIQRMLGHASAAMTLDTYASLFADDLDGVADRLEAARNAAVVQVAPIRDRRVSYLPRFGAAASED